MSPQAWQCWLFFLFFLTICFTESPFSDVMMFWCVCSPGVSQSFQSGSPVWLKLSHMYKDCEFKKKNSLPQVHYIYTYNFVTDTQILGLIFWLTLEILTTLNSGREIYLETKCWIDVRTYANHIRCVLQHSIPCRHCVLVYIFEISG